MMSKSGRVVHGNYNSNRDRCFGLRRSLFCCSRAQRGFEDEVYSRDDHERHLGPSGMLRMAPERIDESENPDGLAAQRSGKVEGQGRYGTMALRHFVSSSGGRAVFQRGQHPRDCYAQPMGVYELCGCRPQDYQVMDWTHGDRTNTLLIPTNTSIITLSQARTYG